MKSNPFKIPAILLTGMLMLAFSCNTQNSRNKMKLSGAESKATRNNDRCLFFVGSGDSGLSHPIKLVELDEDNLAFSIIDSFPDAGGAGYLALSPDMHFLYSSSDENLPGYEEQGSVAAFSLDTTGRLHFLNKRNSGGRENCHVHVSPDGRFVFAANYSSGHATAIEVVEHGMLGDITATMKGEGSGPVSDRQEGPHAHQVMTDPSGRFLLVPDLGTDKVMIYSFDSSTGELSPNPTQPFFKMPPGTGPRHLAFGPGGTALYILGELSVSLTACRFDPEQGRISPLNSASIVAEDFEGKHQSAAVRIHPSGQFIYATNREDISNLAVFKREEDGSISRIQVLENVAYWPRDFNVTPDGKYLILAGGRSNQLELYAIEPETGMLNDTGASLYLPGPICVIPYK